VSCGQSSTPFTVTANSCYNITDVIINGTIHLGPQNSPYAYTFTNVQSNQNISAGFSQRAYNITASAGTGGTITPNGSVPVLCGGSQTFTITPTTGYHITNVVVDGVSQGAISSYTFPNVVANGHTIIASFAINTYTITPTAGTNGAISPNTVQTVNYGSTPTFTFIPNTKYQVDVVTVDGVPVTPSGNTFTFPAVTANHTINVTFVKKPRVNLFYDDFESVFSGWTTSGVIAWYTGTPKYGTHGIRVRTTGQMNRVISTVGYSEIIVSFSIGAAALESGEYVRAEWSSNNGATWTTLKQITSGDTEMDNQLHDYSFSLPISADNNSQLVIRFRISASSTNDNGYFDNIGVSGIPN
jgi:hypothetical protein